MRLFPLPLQLFDRFQPDAVVLLAGADSLAEDSNGIWYLSVEARNLLLLLLPP